MRKVVGAIAICFAALTIIFMLIGGSFGRQFWLASLPGLMQNLAILAVAVLVIDRIFRKERLDKLERTNAEQSQFVLFLCNRLAYLLLKYLGLAREDEVEIGKALALTFEFAQSKMQNTDLAKVFYERLMQAEDKEALVGGFEKTLKSQTEGISKALDDIYPRPDPSLKRITGQMSFSAGSLEAFKGLFEAFKAANAQVGENEQLKPEHLDLLIKIAYSRIGLELQNIKSAIVQLSERAKANKLFFSLD